MTEEKGGVSSYGKAVTVFHLPLSVWTWELSSLLIPSPIFHLIARGKLVARPLLFHLGCSDEQ